MPTPKRDQAPAEPPAQQPDLGRNPLPRLTKGARAGYLQPVPEWRPDYIEPIGGPPVEPAQEKRIKHLPGSTLAPEPATPPDHGLQATTPQGPELLMLDPRDLVDDPENERGRVSTQNDPELAELAESLKERGVLTPLTGYRTPDGIQLLTGHRRKYAAIIADLQTVPLVLRPAPASMLDRSIDRLSDNLQRSDLTAVQKARSIKAMLESSGMSQQALGKKLGKSQAYIANHVRILDLEPSITRMIDEGTLQMGHAVALLTMTEDDRDYQYKIVQTAEQARKKLAHKIVAENWNVRQVEHHAKTYQDDNARRRKAEEEAEARKVAQAQRDAQLERDRAQLQEAATTAAQNGDDQAAGIAAQLEAAKMEAKYREDLSAWDKAVGERRIQRVALAEEYIEKWVHEYAEKGQKELFNIHRWALHSIIGDYNRTLPIEQLYKWKTPADMAEAFIKLLANRIPTEPRTGMVRDQAIANLVEQELKLNTCLTALYKAKKLALEDDPPQPDHPAAQKNETLVEHYGKIEQLDQAQTALMAKYVTAAVANGDEMTPEALEEIATDIAEGNITEEDLEGEPQEL